MVNQDPGKGKVADSVMYNSYSFHIHNTLSILNGLPVYVNATKIVGQNVHRGYTFDQIS